MNIIIEGPDGSGQNYLSQSAVKETGYKIIHVVLA